MSISRDEWMQILEAMHKLIRGQAGFKLNFNENQRHFVYDRLCALQSKIKKYVNDTDKLFDESSDILRRVFANRDQENCTYNSKIGIPVCFEVEQSSVEIDGKYYGDLYFFNRYRKVLEVLTTGETVKREFNAKMYDCKVVETGEDFSVLRIRSNQEFADDLVKKLSSLKVSMTKPVFTDLFNGRFNALDVDLQPKSLFNNLEKYLQTKKRIRLSKDHKERIADLERSYGGEFNTDLLPGMNEDVNIQYQQSYSDGYVKPILRMDDKSDESLFGLDPVYNRKQYFKIKPTPEKIVKTFVKCVKVITTLEIIRDLTLTPGYIKSRIEACFELVKLRKAVQDFLPEEPSIILNRTLLIGYAKEAVQNDETILPEEQDKYIKRLLRSVYQYFDKDMIEGDDYPGASEESEVESDIESDLDFEEDSIIYEKSASNQSGLNEAHYMQWPVGEFEYWPKMNSVFTKISTLEEKYIEIIGQGQVVPPILSSDDINLFSQRLLCLLTRDGRRFLESFFLYGRLPSRRELLNYRVKYALDDIFFMMYCLKKKSETRIWKIIKEVLEGGITTYFKSVNRPLMLSNYNIYSESMRFSRREFKPLIVGFTSKKFTLDEKIEQFKGRFEKTAERFPSHAMCLRYQRDLRNQREEQDFYLSKAIQVGEYFSRYYKKNRKSANLFLDFLGCLVDIKQGDRDRVNKAEANINQKIYLRKSATKKQKYTDKINYWTRVRDTVILKIIQRLLDKNKGSNLHKGSDLLTILIVIWGVASFENSSVPDLIETALVNFINRGTVDLGTYVHFWIFGSYLEDHWIRCKDKTTVEMLSFTKFAVIENNFCALNINDWEDATRNTVSLVTPNLQWSSLKALNCDPQSLFVSYDLQSTTSVNIQKRLKDLKDLKNAPTTLHNPAAKHTFESSKTNPTAFQKDCLTMKKLTGISWSIGSNLGTSVSHVGSKWYLTFNNVFGTIKDKPFEKFQDISGTSEGLVEKMIELFSDVGGKQFNGLSMFLQKLDSIKDTKTFIGKTVKDLATMKLPRHNYVLEFKEFIGILKRLSKSKNTDISKICKESLLTIDQDAMGAMGKRIKNLGELFHNENHAWIEEIKWKRRWKYGKSRPEKLDTEESFRITDLINLVLLVDFVTSSVVKSRFHEKLNKLQLAFSYRFKDKDWSANKANVFKLRNKTRYHDTRGFYVHIPQLSPILEFRRIYSERWQVNFDRNFMHRILNELTFSFYSQSAGDYLIQFPKTLYSNGYLDRLLKEIASFIRDLSIYIKDCIQNSLGDFIQLRALNDRIAYLDTQMLGIIPNTVPGETETQQILTGFENEYTRKMEEKKERVGVFGRDLFLFKENLERFQLILLGMMNSDNLEFGCEEIESAERTLVEDVAVALENPYIRNKFGSKLDKILKYNIYLNSGKITKYYRTVREELLEIQEGLSKRKEKLLEIQEDQPKNIQEILNNVYKLEFNESLVSVDCVSACVDDLLFNLDNYFEDFEPDEELERIEWAIERLQSGFNKYSSLKPEKDYLMKILKYQIMQIVTRNGILKLPGGGTYAKIPIYTFPAADEEIKKIPEGEIKDILTEHFERGREMFPSGDPNVTPILRRLENSEGYMKDLILGIIEEFETHFYDYELSEDISICSVPVAQPVWFTKMKQDLAGYLQFHEDLLRLLSRVKSSKTRVHFKEFCTKVMSKCGDLTNYDEVISRIRDEKDKICDFFNVYFEEEVPGSEILITLYNRNWIKQFKDSFRVACSNNQELKEVLEKLELVRTKDFEDRFEDFWNTFIEKYNSYSNLAPLLYQFKPYMSFLKEKGISIDLSDPKMILPTYLEIFRDGMVQRILEIQKFSVCNGLSSDPVDYFSNLLSLTRDIKDVKGIDALEKYIEDTVHSQQEEMKKAFNKQKGLLDSDSGSSSSDSSDSGSSSSDYSPSSPESPGGMSDLDYSPPGSQTGPQQVSAPLMTPAPPLDSPQPSPDQDITLNPNTVYDMDSDIASHYQNWKLTFPKLKGDEFITSVYKSVRSLCFDIDTDSDFDVFVSALDKLKFIIGVIFSESQWKPFLEAVERATLPKELEILRVEDSNLYARLSDLFNEVITGEYTWLSGGNIVTLRKFVPDKIDDLKNYERQFGISETFLERLKKCIETTVSSGEAKESSGEAKEIYVQPEVSRPFDVPVQVSDFVIEFFHDKIDHTNQRIGTMDFKVFNRKFTNSDQLAFAHIIAEREEMISDAVQDLKTKVSIKNDVFLKELVTQILRKIVVPDTREKHYPVWDEDLNCALCGKGIFDDIHLFDITMNSKLPDDDFSEIEQKLKRENEVPDVNWDEF